MNIEKIKEILNCVHKEIVSWGNSSVLATQKIKITEVLTLLSELEAEQKPERIKCAAIRLKNGEIYEGRNHSEAYGACNKKHPIEEKAHLNAKQGFVTSTGRFVSRKEGGEIAYNARQIQKQTEHLFSEDINYPALVCPKCGREHRCSNCGNEFEQIWWTSV